MTPEEYAEFDRAWRLTVMTTDQRKGQAMFNALYALAPDIANMLRGTTSDPFYRDDRIPEFFRTLGYPQP